MGCGRGNPHRARIELGLLASVGKRDALGLRNGLELGGDSVEHHQSIVGLMVAGELE
jgi:hypothetical protein